MRFKGDSNKSSGGCQRFAMQFEIFAEEDENASKSAVGFIREEKIHRETIEER